MYAVISSPNLWKKIEEVINSKEEEILFKEINNNININEALEKIKRIAVKHIIIDFTAINEGEHNAFVQALRRYRIMNDKTQIIVIAPNVVPGNQIIHSLVTMGIYDIIAPEAEEIENVVLQPKLSELLQSPSKYKNAVRWFVDGEVGVTKEGIVDKEKHSTKEIKTKVKIEYKEIIKSVFKEVITVYSPTSEGSSKIAAHLAHAIAASKECKVLLIDFNVLKPMQRELFEVKSEFTLKDVFDSVIKKTLTPVMLENFTIKSKANKNLDILTGLYDINEYYDSLQTFYQEIIEKAKFNYDYVVIDTHSCYDLYPTHAALLIADHILVPVRGRKYSIDTVNRYLNNFNEYGDYDIRKFKLIVNQYSGNDLTSIEIQSKTNYTVIGYISNYKEYDMSNGFKNNKIMNEYVDILNSIGIRAIKKGRIWDRFKLKKIKKQGDS